MRIRVKKIPIGSMDIGFIYPDTAIVRFHPMADILLLVHIGLEPYPAETKSD